MAFVAPERANLNIGDVSYIPFRAALDLYARAAETEVRQQRDRLRAMAAGERGNQEDKTAEVEISADDPAEPEPGAFVGYAAGEKRNCFMRLTSYVNRNGPGAKRDIVNAGYDSFTM